MNFYIGLMSGTSLDAIDSVLVDFSPGFPKLYATHRKTIDEQLRIQLSELTQPGTNEIDRLGQLDTHLGQLFAETVLELLQKADVKPQEVIAIGSSGQTIRHRPNLAFPFTLQIADPNHIVEKTGITTVADLRRRDMALGGQGAPLVPAFQAYLFQNSLEDRIVLNLGGIANITYLPKDKTQAVLGFDTGPGNTLIDHWFRKHREDQFDREGGWAAQGQIDEALLQLWLQDPYFKQTPPKSTGTEYFHLARFEAAITEQKSADVQVSLCELTAQTIILGIQSISSDAQILVCGGGINNHYLMNRLKSLGRQYRFHSTAEFGLDPIWAEAIAFAWIAKQTLEGHPSNLISVTGASRPAVLGGIYRPFGTTAL